MDKEKQNETICMVFCTLVNIVKCVTDFSSSRDDNTCNALFILMFKPTQLASLAPVRFNPNTDQDGVFHIKSKL